MNPNFFEMIEFSLGEVKIPKDPLFAPYLEIELEDE